MITAVSPILERGGDSLGGFLPKLGGALVLLVVGLLLARLVAALIGRALHAAGVDGLAERFGAHDVLERAGFERSLTGIVRKVLRLALSVVVVFAALSLLGLQFLSQSLNQGILFLPKLLIALVLILAGLVVASLVRDRVDRIAYQMDFPVPLGQLAQVAVLAVFVITAAAQIGVSTMVVMVLLGILVAASAATVTLAFGLGGRDVARALSAGRYVDGAFEVGETISFADVTGKITAIEPTATLLSTPEGHTVRVPNHLLLESVVTRRPAAPA